MTDTAGIKLTATEHDSLVTMLFHDYDDESKRALIDKGVKILNQHWDRSQD